MPIEKVAVIGAGVMGSAIAAHFANAGVVVDLLDIVPDGAEDRDAIAKKAIARMLKTKPAPFMHPRMAERVTPGNIEDHLERISDADWIVEAVIEDVRIKQQVYRTIDAGRKEGSIVSSNTSTIPLQRLIEGLPEAFACDFAITHFFNPPRYMRLLELVPGEATRPEVIANLAEFCDRRLGKGVVVCKDTPGFIANRIGTFWIQCAVNEALDAGLRVEEADAVLGRPAGIPKSGVFGLIDLIGLDLIPPVLDNLLANLPAEDGLAEIYREPTMITEMVAVGYTGRKGKGGFYRLNVEGGQRVKEARNLTTGAYAEARKPRYESIRAARRGGLKALVHHADPGGRYARRVLFRTLAYAAEIATEIADSIHVIDAAMRLGYNWDRGPFQMIDALGPEWLAEALQADGIKVPDLLEAARGQSFYRQVDGADHYLSFSGTYEVIPHPKEALTIADLRRSGKPLASNASASVWDMGDGVALLEFHTKMNTFDPDTLVMMDKALTLVQEREMAGLVIGNDGENFSAGVNLGLALFTANIALWSEIERFMIMAQTTFRALKYAPFPVVGAPTGLALGGGCEILLHCDAIQAHAESYIGLVEVGVGVIPAAGGCTQFLQRRLEASRGSGGSLPAIIAAFETIGLAKVATSAAEARDLGLLRPEDGITMNRTRVLIDAKARVLSMTEGYQPPDPPRFSLPGESGLAALMMAVDGLVKQGKASAHDRVVAQALAVVLTGGDVDITDELQEEDLAKLERDGFLALIRTPLTLARIEHMLDTGKPLRN